MSSRKLNVVFLTSARAWRGSGVSFSNVALGLAARGHQPYMLAGEASVVAEFRARGLPASQIPTANTGLLPARALLQVLRSRTADCLLVDRPRDLRLAALASIAHPVALVSRYNLSRRTPPRDLLSRLAYRAVDLTIFISATSARQALATASYMRRRPYRIIPGAVGPGFHPDLDAADAFRRRHDLGEADFLLAVGSLTADKRYDLLLDAVARLGANRPPLVICGAGPLEAQLRSRATALGLQVYFLGLVPPELLRGAYTAAVCLLHACEIETFGLSVLEAMSCGLPVLAVAGGAVPEVLGDAGWLAPPNDPAQFSKRLSELLGNPELRKTLGAAARSRSQQFSLGSMQDSYVEAVESISAAAKSNARVHNPTAAPHHL